MRFMTYNIRDTRPEHVLLPEDRVRQAALLIREADVTAVLINELAYTEDGAHYTRFAKLLAEGTGFTWDYFAAPSNTGIHSGMDLDNDGQADPNAEGRAYGGDCFGYGEFPGHYAMALFVRSDAAILREHSRTFQKLLWNAMPGALLPHADGTGAGSWYSDDELAAFRLSSKSHWDVPVRLSDGSVVHLLCAHPTPPVFDGDEDRNGRRNHDEIRLWLDYIDDAAWITDDAGESGGLDPSARFIIMGDLNADPADGSSTDAPAAKMLAHQRVDGGFLPISAVPGESRNRGPHAPQDTSNWGLRVDYAQPSSNLRVLTGGVIRGEADLKAARRPSRISDPVPDIDLDEISDHYPVWVEIGLQPAMAPAS